MSATATDNEHRTTESRSRTKRAPKLIEAWQHRRLRGLWKDISPNISADFSDSADPERAARMDYSSKKLGKMVRSWKELTKADAGELIHAMRVDLGRDPRPGEVRSSEKAKPDALEIIARLALELYGGDWHAALKERLTQRPFFHYAGFDQITPRQSHELIEILFDHLERKLFPDDAGMDVRKERKEALRGHLKPQRR